MSVFFRVPIGRAARRWLAACVPLLICGALAHAGSAPAGSHAQAARPAAKAPAPPPLKIGEINTYKALPAFSEAYRRGWMLALEQINAEGGVLGRKIDVRSRDDHGSPDDAVRAAQALADKDGVVALFGGYSSEVALALSRHAMENKVLYLAVAPLSQRLTWQDGNRYTFRLRPAAWMQAAAVAPKALGLRKLRWALVYQDTESDRATVDAFKGLMRTFQSKTEFVAEQALPAGKPDAGAAAGALAAAKPDAVFNMLTGKPLADFVRAGVAAHLFDGRPVVSLFTGDPENLAVLDASLPDGWIITGYPRDAVDTPENRSFVQAYAARYQEAPDTAAVLGYAAMRSIAEGLKRAGSPEREALAAAFVRLQVPTPFGVIEYRNLDHQSTLGTYLGYTGHADGKPVMERFVYTSGTRLQPPDEQIRRLRVQAARKAAGMDGQAKDARDEATPVKGGQDEDTQRAPHASPAARGGAAAGEPGQSMNGAQDAASQAATQGAAPSAAQPRTRPNTRPDTALTSRLRGARPVNAAPAGGPAAAPASVAPTTAGTPSVPASAGTPNATPPSLSRAPAVIHADTPPAAVSTPVLPDWPDQVVR